MFTHIFNLPSEDFLEPKKEGRLVFSVFAVIIPDGRLTILLLSVLYHSSVF